MIGAPANANLAARGSYDEMHTSRCRRKRAKIKPTLHHLVARFAKLIFPQLSATAGFLRVFNSTSAQRLQPKYETRKKTMRKSLQIACFSAARAALKHPIFKHYL